MSAYYLYRIINSIFTIVELIVLARVIISWLPVDRYNRYVDLLYRITEPVFAPVRNMLDRTPLGGFRGIDFSPLVILILLDIIRRIVVNIIF
ncbi:MAG: YggT family protein [Clostridiales bacterium]|nr:YggT family protein [Clostridiales bacterium]